MGAVSRGVAVGANVVGALHGTELESPHTPTATPPPVAWSGASSVGGEAKARPSGRPEGTGGTGRGAAASEKHATGGGGVAEPQPTSGRLGAFPPAGGAGPGLGWMSLASAAATAAATALRVRPRTTAAPATTPSQRRVGDRRAVLVPRPPQDDLVLVEVVREKAVRQHVTGDGAENAAVRVTGAAGARPVGVVSEPSVQDSPQLKLGLPPGRGNAPGHEEDPCDPRWEDRVILQPPADLLGDEGNVREGRRAGRPEAQGAELVGGGAAPGA